MSNTNQTLRRAVRHAIASTAAFAAIAGLAAPAQAQSTTEGLEEIVVTAQKREQSLQNVPMSVSVVSADMIRNSGATDFDALIPRIPGVSGFTTGVATNVWAIRGLSSNTSGSGGEPSVGFYQDEAFAGYVEFASFPLFDTNRIEVAKGPQGTLYGKNSTAGAILVYTNRPDPAASAANVSLSAGNLGQFRAEAAGNLPLTDNIALRLSGMYENLDDYQKNMVVRGADGGGFERWGARLGATWDILDNLRAYAFYQQSDASSNQWMMNLQARTGDRNPEHVYSQLPETTDEISTYAGHLSIEWDLSDAISFKSITDYRAMTEYNWEADAVGMTQPALRALTTAALRTPIDTVLATQGARRNTGKNFGTDMFQQELRASWTGDQLFVQGGFNYNEYFERRPQQAAVIHFAPIPQLPFRKVDSTGFEATHESKGAFADATYEVTDRWTVTAGIRFSKEDLESTNFSGVDLHQKPASGFAGISYLDYTSGLPFVAGCSAGSLTSPQAPCVAGIKDSRSDEGWTPRVAVSFDLTDSTTLFANYAEGFKAGGFDIVTNGDSLRTYEPENVEAYEIGAKGQYPSLRYSAAVYYNKYDDLQVSAIVNAVNQTRNAAAATAKGFDGEVTWAALDNLEVFATYAYTDAEYDKGQVLGVSAKGLRLIRTPENSVNVGVDWRIPVGDFGAFNVQPFVHYQSEMELNLANRPDLRQPSYTTVDLRVGLTPNNGGWNAALVGENLTGEEIIIRAADLVGFGAALGYRPTEPLVRLEVGYKFGANY